MDSWLACHEFQTGTAEDPPYREGRCILNLSRLKYPPVGVEVKIVDDQLGNLPRHMTVVQNYELHEATDLVILNHGQVTRTIPDLAPPLLTTTPHQREDV
ncbi:hypothetical protein TNCV_1145321 [Trichonephila clavipes]|nr:hypothetical protein TNCV_1145321 [Trichonephila clavipes]